MTLPSNIPVNTSLLGSGGASGGNQVVNPAASQGVIPTTAHPLGHGTPNSASYLSTSITNAGIGSGAATFITSNTTSTTSTTGQLAVYTNGTNAVYIANQQTYSNFLLGKQAQRVKLGDTLYDVLGALWEIDLGVEATIKLPDDTALWINADGSYRIVDKHARVVRKGLASREFNRFINASDLLEQFIKDLGHVGVKQDQVLSIPVELFINWLIVKAAEQDGDPIPQDVPELKTVVKKNVPRCKCCGRFLLHEKAKVGLLFCSADHYSKFERKTMTRLGVSTTQAVEEKTNEPREYSEAV